MTKQESGAASSTRKLRTRNEQRLLTGALLTEHCPAGAVKLVPDPALNLYSEFHFEPYGSAAGGVVFGTLRCGYLPRGLSLARLKVKRGRWGSKPPEDLQLLQPLPTALASEPALRQRGVLRSISAAYADIGAARLNPLKPAVPGRAELYLAVELAFHGWFRAESLRLLAGQHAEPLPRFAQGTGSAVLATGPLLVWRGFLRRNSTQLEEMLKQPKRANPLRRTLSESQVASLLALERRGLAAAVLDDFAALHQLAAHRRQFPRTYDLAGPFLPPELKPADSSALQAILTALKTEPQLGRRELASRFPGSQHVIAWLFESERLIELPGGASLEQADLYRYLRTFPAGPGKPVPSVREIKDRLGLGRRSAEGLRSWYANCAQEERES